LNSGSYNNDSAEPGAEIQRGETQVIDISRGGSSGTVNYKPVVRVGPVQISTSFYVHEAPG
jgi:hypothetical protein